MDCNQYESLLKRLTEVYGCASVIMGVINGDQTRYFGAGKRDIETGEAPDEHTVYGIGSCTKSFTAAAVAMLAGEGKLRFDEPVRTYLPELTLATPELTCGLTLRDALCHRSGLPGNTLAWIPFLDEYDDEKLMSQLARCEPAAPLRTRMIYSNQMYMLLGRVIERVSGMKWADFIRERLLEPIGMNQTYVDPLAMNQMKNASRPYLLLDGKLVRVPYSRIRSMAPAGGMMSTAHDMLKWIRFHLDGGAAGGRQLIESDAFGQCHVTQMPILPGAFDYMNMERKHAMGYGFGLFTEDYAGHTVLQHSGNIDGYSAMFSFAPRDALGIIVLINTAPCLMNTALPYYVYDEAFGLSFADHGIEVKTWIERMMAEDASPDETRLPLPEYALDELAGTYEDALYGRLTVRCEDGAIRGRLGKYEVSFEHVSGGGYFARIPPIAGDDPFHAVFQTNVFGHVDALKLTYDKTVVYSKIRK